MVLHAKKCLFVVKNVCQIFSGGTETETETGIVYMYIVFVYTSIKGRFLIRPLVTQLVSSPLPDSTRQRMAVAGPDTSGEGERAAWWKRSSKKSTLREGGREK